MHKSASGYLTINALFLKANELVDFYFYLFLFTSMLYVHLVSHLPSLSFLLSVLLSVQEENIFIAHKQLNLTISRYQCRDSYLYKASTC